MGVTTMREGAVRWMAPEVIDTGKCTMAGDVYSFGCVCLEVSAHVDSPLPSVCVRMRLPVTCRLRRSSAEHVHSPISKMKSKSFTRLVAEDDPNGLCPTRAMLRLSVRWATWREHAGRTIRPPGRVCAAWLKHKVTTSRHLPVSKTRTRKRALDCGSCYYGGIILRAHDLVHLTRLLPAEPCLALHINSYAYMPRLLDICSAPR